MVSSGTGQNCLGLMRQIELAAISASLPAHITAAHFGPRSHRAAERSKRFGAARNSRDDRGRRMVVAVVPKSLGRMIRLKRSAARSALIEDA
jgi:hypothetical protein